MMNRVILVGRLARDPELRYTTTNIATCSFTVAVNRPYTNQQTQDKTADFIPVVAWRNQAENVAKFMKKGSLVGVEGRIQIRNYDDKDGVKRYVTEVIADNVTFLESKGNSQDSSSYSNDDYNKKENEEENEDFSKDSYSTEDLPF